MRVFLWLLYIYYMRGNLLARQGHSVAAGGRINIPLTFRLPKEALLSLADAQRAFLLELAGGLRGERLQLLLVEAHLLLGKHLQ